MYDADWERLKAVTLDGTKLCFPASYSPDGYSSENEEQIYVPAQKIAERVPGFTEKHTNVYGWDYVHNVQGTAYASSAVNWPIRDVRDAWAARQHPNDFLIESDPDFPLYRIYEGSERSNEWNLVETLPPGDPTGLPPDSWYIGSCLELAGTYSCMRPVEYESITYFYDVSRENLHLRDEVRDAVLDLLSDWQESCLW
jgi:hypothetical protein